MVGAVKENILQFILGGTSEFTIINRLNNVAVKYKIQANKGYNTWFVHVGEGNSYKYAGYIRRVKEKNSISYHRGEKGIFAEDSKEIKALFWVIKNQDRLGKEIDVIHHGKCSVCGRPLTDEISIVRGIGPTCFKKILNILC